MTTFNVGEYSVSTIATSTEAAKWVGLFSITRITEEGTQLVASLKRAPGSFTDMMRAISDADEAARAFIAGL